MADREDEDDQHVVVDLVDDPAVAVSVALGAPHGITDLVVIGVDTTRIADMFAEASVYPAAQNLLLAANTLGYGSALTNFTVIRSRTHCEP